MKFRANYIKFPLVLILVIFLFGFAGKRHDARKLIGTSVEFTNNENLYITAVEVENLLPKKENVKDELLNLHNIEERLDQNNMIENAEVFVKLDGTLSAIVSQRKPIGRAIGSTSFYLDRNGLIMPLSKNYSARVPLLIGFDKELAPKVTELLNYIKNDKFLNTHITEITHLKNNRYQLSLRKLDFKVYFGELKNINLKFNNFKAFYKKALKDKKLDTYKKVNLQFGNQVVCTKK
ncbi:cell division protein FtsQ/DivIB [Zunongwangia sp.]|uniref:cell division protein FtsQ/DivIB n=1 Tax=Zunongwangia sp. TaxID=1965325 RepID=UPI003AA9461C